MTTPGAPARVEGFVLWKSRSDGASTAVRAVAALADHDLTLIARVDHAEAAARVGLVLGFTQLLIFGNPRAGTPLMQAARTIGCDLPLRLLIWTDDADATWIGYDDPHWLAKRHGAEVPAVTDRMARTLAEIAAAASDIRKG